MPSSSDDAQQREAARAAWAIAPSVLLAGVAGGIAFPILPLVGADAGLPLAFIGLILAANRVVRVFSSPVIGAIADQFGGRRTLIIGMMIQVVVMALYVLGVTTGRPGLFFLLGRMLHGLGSACVFVSAQMLALHAGGREHGGRAAGTVRAAMSIGIPVGLVAGGVLADLWGVAQTFEAAVLALVAATVVAFWLVPDLRSPLRRRTNLRDTLKALTNGRLAAVGGLNFAASFSVQGMLLTTMVLLVRERGISLLHFGPQGTSGALLGLMIIIDAPSMTWFGRLGDRLHAHARIAMLGLGLLVPALVIIGAWHTLPGLCVGLALVGIGGGALGPSLLALLGQLTPSDARGASVGLLQLCGDVGGALGPLVGTALLASNADTPYFVSAALLACFFPMAVWLARRAPEAAPVAHELG